MPSRWQMHVQRWSNCHACKLCETRRNVVLARGQITSDVVFIGEAPGKSEDTLASPFEGPAGQLLDEIVNRSVGRFHRTLRVSFSNLIACIPWDEVENNKTAKPPDWAVEACKPRLQEFLAIADPRLLVCVGKEALYWLQPGFRSSVKLPKKIEQVDINHPSWMLQHLSAAHRNLAVLRAAAQITQGLEKVFGSAASQSQV